VRACVRVYSRAVLKLRGSNHDDERVPVTRSYTDSHISAILSRGGTGREAREEERRGEERRGEEDEGLSGSKATAGSTLGIF
jgi:hypothetical protein